MPKIDSETVGDLLLLEPASKAQIFIGDKVRHAEDLRELARGLEAEVVILHAQYTVQPAGIDFTKRTRRLDARSLNDRLDAHFYPSAVEQYFREFNLAKQSLDRLCSLVANGQSQPESTDGVQQATVTNLGRSFVDGLMRTVERPAEGSLTLAPHDLLLCNAAHEKSYIGRDVTYSQVDGPYPSTEVMVVRVDRTQIPASFVRHHLKTQIGYLQIQSTIRGITAHSYPSDMRLVEIPIPNVPVAERPAWFATDDKMLAAGRCFDLAGILTTAAKLLVEALIEGKVTEAELVAAQEALERGDATADRALLRRLTRHGLDVPGQPPLFPYLDALYTLLAQTREGNP
jgi:type I restriction enzyme S subunit